MKNKSRWLALMLTGSMMVSPLSYTRTYAAENEQQYETNLQETVEVEEADLDKKQDESQTEDAGNVKEDKGNDDLTKEDQKEERICTGDMSWNLIKLIILRINQIIRIQSKQKQNQI